MSACGASRLASAACHPHTREGVLFQGGLLASGFVGPSAAVPHVPLRSQPSLLGRKNEGGGAEGPVAPGHSQESWRERVAILVGMVPGRGALRLASAPEGAWPLLQAGAVGHGAGGAACRGFAAGRKTRLPLQSRGETSRALPSWSRLHWQVGFEVQRLCLAHGFCLLLRAVRLPSDRVGPFTGRVQAACLLTPRLLCPQVWSSCGARTGSC